MGALFKLLLLVRLLEPMLPYEIDAGIPYKTVDRTVLRMDVIAPITTDTTVPAVVFVHGGAWNFGWRTDNADMARRLAGEGIAAVLVGFRDSYEAGIDGQVEDIKDAVRWVRAHAGDYGIDPDRIGLFGSSSGGHIGALAAFAGNGEGFGDDPPGSSSRVQACLLLYGVYDFAPGSAGRDIVGEVFDGYADSAMLARYSARTYIDGTEPETLVIHGTNDAVVPYSEGEALVASLQAAGVPAEFLPVEGLGHGFARKQPWLRPWLVDTTAVYFHSALNEK